MGAARTAKTPALGRGSGRLAQSPAAKIRGSEVRRVASVRRKPFWLSRPVVASQGCGRAPVAVRVKSEGRVSPEPRVTAVGLMVVTSVARRRVMFALPRWRRRVLRAVAVSVGRKSAARSIRVTLASGPSRWAEARASSTPPRPAPRMMIWGEAGRQARNASHAAA